jgi:ATP-binding cassette subfamily F protein 3
MIKLTGINKMYLGEDLLKDISWHMKPGEKIGLIGPNGTGKTTQLRIICGHEEPDSGEVYVAPGTRIGYLSQEPIVNPENTLNEEMYSVFKNLLEVEQQIKDIQKQLPSVTDEKVLDSELKQLSDLQEYFETNDGFAIDARIGQVISGLRFSEEDRNRHIKTFSGGWQMRISIAKLLLQSPDLLLLDEPTNHLDIRAIEWLESYLANYKGGFIIVSHDRQFLDKTVNRIIEMDGPRVTLFWTNYTGYLEEKEKQYELQLAAYNHQQKKLARDKAFIDKFRASAARSSQAKSREKQLEKLDLIEPPRKTREIKFWFPAGIKSEEEVLKIKHLYKAYDEQIIFNDLNLIITRKDKIALIGSNGSGKTTLLRVIMELDKDYKGKLKFGQLVKPMYFNQHEARSLSGAKTVFEELHDSAPSCTNEHIRTILGRFGITGDNVLKCLDDLSGGEKARLALAKMLTAGANFLIFDEPTNHLDIPAKEALEQALTQFEGTVIVVTHDRKLIDNFANKILEIENQNITVYPGNYSYYRLKKEKEEVEKDYTVNNACQKEKKSELKKEIKDKIKKKSPKNIEKEIAKKEKDIMEMEEKVGQLEERLAKPEFYQSSPDEFVKLSEELELMKEKLCIYNEEWETLIDLLEETLKTRV